jgi:hypothetical protein
VGAVISPMQCSPPARGGGRGNRSALFLDPPMDQSMLIFVRVGGRCVGGGNTAHIILVGKVGVRTFAP